MIDCNLAMEPGERRTCGTCAHCEPSEWHCDSKASEYSWMVDVDDVDLPCGGYGYERRTDGVAERYERLAQVAREMFDGYVRYFELSAYGGCDLSGIRKELEELGVSVDD